MKVLVFDCDGVLRPVDSLIRVTLECLGKYFNMQIRGEGAANNVSSFSGGTFREAYFKALEFFVPGYNKEEAEKCYGELSEKRAAIYKEAEIFPEAVNVLQRLSRTCHLIISSGLERHYIEEWLREVGIASLFETIYTVEEDGGKKKHIQMIRENYPGKKILFVGDAISEMQLGVPAIAVARDNSQKQLLWTAGAKAVVSSLNEILDLDLDSL